MQDSTIESICIEINLRKKKWFLCFSYNPNKGLISSHLNTLGKTLDVMSSNYENIVLIGDFNVDMSNDYMKDFCELYHFKNLIKGPTCFKNFDNPSSIDLILTNKYRSFCNSCTVETGLSDFHRMVVTVLKTSFQKLGPKIIKYRDYKNFSNEYFKDNVMNEIGDLNHTLASMPFDQGIDIFKRNLDLCAPIKQKYVRANNKPFVNKIITKAIMTRTRLRNKFLKNKTAENRIAYNKQRNQCLALVRKTKLDFFSNLDHKLIADNKTFWKTLGPCFSEKSKTSTNITLVEEELVQDSKKIADIFNGYFSNVVASLNIPKYEVASGQTGSSKDPLLKSIENFKNHPSILMIQNRILNSSFKFHAISKEEVENEILGLSNSKATQEYDIPTKIIKMNASVFSEILSTEFNRSLELCEFPKSMKLADVTPVYKKGNRFKKENYRPVSILSNLSKIFEKCIYKQLSIFFENKFSKYQCGFRKNHSAQHSLIAMLENWRACVDQGLAFGALLTDLSKAFDCLPHDLLAAKIHAFGLDIKSSRFILDYLTNRMQRTKICNKFSSWEYISSGVPQGSILGPFLFNIYMCDLFYFIENFQVASYADDTTPYASGKDISSVISSLEEASFILFDWFKNNQMQGNPDKCHVLLSTQEKYSININGKVIENSSQEKLLGVNIDSGLKFNDHIKSICGKARAKLNALSRVSPFLDIDKRKLIMNSFFNAQFNYCPLIWMLHNRTLNKKINRLHEKCLRIVYSDNSTSYENLLTIDNSFPIHKRNLQLLAIELYKILHDISPVLMKDVFLLHPPSNYNLRNTRTFHSRPVKSVNFGTESLTFLAYKIWDKIPEHIKKSESLSAFKSAIKNWSFENCDCRLCKCFIPQVGFV
mgnify:FL=1